MRKTGKILRNKICHTYITINTFSKIKQDPFRAILQLRIRYNKLYNSSIISFHFFFLFRGGCDWVYFFLFDTDFFLFIYKTEGWMTATLIFTLLYIYFNFILLYRKGFFFFTIRDKKKRWFSEDVVIWWFIRIYCKSQIKELIL